MAKVGGTDSVSKHKGISVHFGVIFGGNTEVAEIKYIKKIRYNCLIYPRLCS